MKRKEDGNNENEGSKTRKRGDEGKEGSDEDPTEWANITTSDEHVVRKGKDNNCA